jgi:hypothetical protein
LQLARPESLNALSSLTLAEIEQAAIELDDEPGLKVVVVSGQGRAFCAGADVNGFVGQATRRERDQGWRTARALEQLGAVTVARIQGWCVGGGVVLASACDLRVAADDARFLIPEVDLGRLSVARSPDHVLDRAYDEALLTMASMADFYNLSLDEMITELSLNWDAITIIDSPLQNLALLRDALDGAIDLSAVGISNDIDTLMAVFLGVASDKTVPITADTAYAISVIFELPLTQAEAEALAADAEAIRIAVLAGHG